jgi:glycosyltransferase involved in cell wall biosynthesis
MRLVILSTCWNIENYIIEYIESIKIQTYKDFIVYLIDDMSSDNTFNIAKQKIGNDNRFILIKNNIKKWKTKNFIDVVMSQEKLIKWDDVLVEIDADDKLAHENVLMKIYNIYLNKNIWICGSKWNTFCGHPSKYGIIIPEKARTGYTIFSHLRTYKAFLFRAIRDEDLKMNGEYFKAATDIAYGIPMLEMAGSEHYYFLNEVTYIYRRYNNQSASVTGGTKDPKLQRKSSGYILKLPKYKKLILASFTNMDNIKGEIKLIHT